MPSCIAKEYPITIHQGGTYEKDFSYSISGVNVNLQGYTGYCNIKTKQSSPSVLLAIPNGNGSFEEDGPSGIYFYQATNAEGAEIWKFKIYINDEDSLLLCPGKIDYTGFYTLYLKSAAGEVVLKLYGSADIKASA